MAALLAQRIRNGLILLVTILGLVPVQAFGGTETALRDAENLLKQKQFSRALEVLHDLERSLPDPHSIDNLLAVAYLGYGVQQLADAEFERAAAAFQEGRRYNAFDIRLWQGEAIGLFRQGRYGEAVALLDRALGIAPDNPAIYHLLGRAYYAEGRMREALDALQRSRELGGGEEVADLQQKVHREWQVEQQMEFAYRGHFRLSFVGGDDDSGLVEDILAVLEDAYVELGSALNFYPAVRIPVLLYTHQDYARITRSPDWSGALYDGKIRLPLAGLPTMTDAFAAVLYHEYMHVLVHLIAQQRAPVWLNEGLAETAGRRLHGSSLSVLPKALERGRLLSWDKLAQPFNQLAEQQVPLAYEQSYALVSFMIDRFGWHKMAELLRELAVGRGWQEVIGTVYVDHGLDWPAIRDAWQASLY